MTLRTIASIVVSYNTAPDRLRQLIERLGTTTSVIVVDNSTQASVATQIEQIVQAAGAQYLGCNGNVGVGAAQNRGIALAKTHGASAVLLMDDDSMPDKGMVCALAAVAASPGSSSPCVVCATPLAVDVVRTDPAPDGAPFPVRDMMSSGSLIPMAVLDTVGPFDEGLFVDLIDFDWGWRAQARGVPIVKVPRARLRHRLGDRKRLPFGLSLNVPSPVRHYYQARNLILVWPRHHVPAKWKWSRTLLTPTKFAMVLVFSDRRSERILHFIRGVVDGFHGASTAVEAARTA